jgi:opacity protein-like surface antigen
VTSDDDATTGAAATIASASAAAATAVAVAAASVAAAAGIHCGQTASSGGEDHGAGDEYSGVRYEQLSVGGLGEADSDRNPVHYGLTVNDGGDARGSGVDLVYNAHAVIDGGGEGDDNGWPIVEAQRDGAQLASLRARVDQLEYDLQCTRRGPRCRPSSFSPS